MKIKMDLVFSGPFKEAFEGYVLYKEALGVKLDNENRKLRSLVRMNEFFNAFGQHEIILTEEMVMAYIERNPGVSSSTKHTYECDIRQFAIYLRNQGYSEVHVLPEKHSRITTDFVPYIYSKAEIGRIFSATDRLENLPNNPHFRIFFQTILRLLYCTGLRISEALELKLESVDFENNLLIVNSGKGNVSRLVPFNDYLRKWLIKYKQEAVRPTDTYFFESPQGGKRNRVGFRHTFSGVILPMAQIHRKPDNSGPRVHDLRHTFACHSLDQMVRSGMDAFCALPYLSTYMGHKGIESTEIYLRLTADHFQEITEAGHYIFAESVGDPDE